MLLIHKYFKYLKRIKFDLTKYIEEHTFTFDHAFSEINTNEDVTGKIKLL